jgi:hypothetical protein
MQHKINVINAKRENVREKIKNLERIFIMVGTMLVSSYVPHSDQIPPEEEVTEYSEGVLDNEIKIIKDYENLYKKYSMDCRDVRIYRNLINRITDGIRKKGDGKSQTILKEIAKKEKEGRYYNDELIDCEIAQQLENRLDEFFFRVPEIAERESKNSMVPFGVEWDRIREAYKMEYAENNWGDY